MSIADSELLVKLIFTIVSFVKIIVNSCGQGAAEGAVQKFAGLLNGSRDAAKPQSRKEIDVWAVFACCTRRTEGALPPEVRLQPDPAMRRQRAEAQETEFLPETRFLVCPDGAKTLLLDD
ncbi:MAG: hypothetical protein ACKO4U_09865 [Caldilinea sp.]